MKEVGVEALVEGLAKFLGDMGKINSSLDRVRSHGTLLQKAFGTIGDAMSAFGQKIWEVARHALGELLADAIRGVITWLQDMGKAVLDSADDFQKMQIRLERLNFNSATESGKDYNEAMEEAVRLTKEQLDWTIRLGATTPYDAKDIANIYTLARGYGFSADEAKGLTESVVEFTAGMGLSNVELERIIINFGQLRQQGKLNSQDLRDLARGAFVPINKVIEITAQKLGITVEEFNKLRARGKLGAEAVEVFREAFEELVGVNFQGAAEALGNVFSVAIENVQSLIRDMLAAYVVGPVLLTIGGYIQNLTDSIAKNDERWNKLTESLKKIGETASEIIGILLNFAPSTDDMADKVVDAVERIADWFAEHKMDIVDWVKNAVAWIKDTLIPAFRKVWKIIFGGTDEITGEKKTGVLENIFKWLMENKDYISATIKNIGNFIQNYIIRTVERIAEWVSQNRPMIDEFFKSLLDIIANVVADLTGKNVEGGTDFLGSILNIIQSIMTFINENKTGIADFIAALIRVSIILDVMKTIFSFLIGVVIGVVTVVAKLAAAFIFISNQIGGLIVLITFLLTMLLAFGPRLAEILIQLWFIIKYYFGKMWESVKEFAANIWQSLVDGWNNLVDAAKEFFSMLWQGAVEGWEKIKRSFSEAWENIKQTATETWVALETGWTDFRQKIGTTLEQLWFIIKYYFNKSWDSIKEAVSNWWTSIKEKVSLIWQTVSEWFGKTKDTILQKITEAWEKVQSIDWAKVGAGIISGMVQGVLGGAASLISAVVGAAISAYEAALAALGIASPSKLFMEVGELTMEGMAIGIRRAAGLAAEAMGSAMSQVAMPAVALPSVAAGASAPTQVYNSTRNYNLSIQTSAASEPIIQDFNMLESLGG